MQFTAYDSYGFFDEIFQADGHSRAGSALLVQHINALAEGELLHRQRAAEQALLHMGITFNVYGDEAGTERIFPFDIIPHAWAARVPRCLSGQAQRCRHGDL